eukprot:1661929-Amphidinium_carterae.1
MGVASIVMLCNRGQTGRGAAQAAACGVAENQRASDLSKIANRRCHTRSVGVLLALVVRWGIEASDTY